MTLKETREFIKSAEGKTIQIKHGHGWIDVEDDSQVMFICERSEYRIKPKPKLRAWTAEDVPVGSILREKTRHARKFILAGCSEFGGYIEVAKDCAPLGFSAVLENYEHSTDGGKTWLPCGVLEGGE